MSLLLLAGMVAAVYGPSLRYAFQYDDVHSIVENPHIRSVRNIPLFFWHPEMFSRDPTGAMYRPLVLVSYALSYALAGYAGPVYHVFNLFVHLLDALLVGYLARLVGLRRGPAGTAGALFALHPVNAEVVDYVSSRSESLCALGLLVGLAAYIRGTRGGGAGLREGSSMPSSGASGAEDGELPSWRWRIRAWRALSLSGMLVALASKAVGVTLVPVLVLWEVIVGDAGDPARKGGRSLQLDLGRILRRQWPYWLVAGGYLLAVHRLWVAAVVENPVRGLGTQMTTQIKALAYYAFLLAMPVELSVEHPFRLAAAWSESGVLAAAALVLSVALFVGWQGVRRHRSAFWVLFGLSILLPTLLVPLNVLVNEHRLYLPSAAAVILGVSLAGGASGKFDGRLKRFGVMLLLCCAVLAAERTRVWASPRSLWQDALKKAPTMPRPHLYMGDVEIEAGRPDSALMQYHAALNVYPAALTPRERVVIHNNAGAAYLRMGRYVDALQAYQQALQLDSTYVLARQGREAAAALLEQKHDPQAELLRKQGLNLMIAGKVDAAIARLQESLDLDPDPQTWMALGLAYERGKDLDGARRTYAILARLASGQPYGETALARLRELEARH